MSVLVGLFAGTDTHDRAVLTGLRNFIRDMGGAVGTTGKASPLVIGSTTANSHPVSGVLLSNILSRGLSSKFSPSLVAKLTSSMFALKDLNLPKEDVQLILNSYMDGIHGVFFSYSALIAMHLCACLLIEDYGLKSDKRSNRN